MFAFTQRSIHELKTIHKKTDDDRIYSSVEYFLFYFKLLDHGNLPEEVLLCMQNMQKAHRKEINVGSFLLHTLQKDGRRPIDSNLICNIYRFNR